MNVLYSVVIPAEVERTDRVRSSVKLCLEATAMAAEVQETLMALAGAMLTLAASWADAPEALVAFRLESGARLAVSVSCMTASEAAIRAVTAISEHTDDPSLPAEARELVTCAKTGKCTLHASTDGRAFTLEASMAG